MGVWSWEVSIRLTGLRGSHNSRILALNSSGAGWILE